MSIYIYFLQLCKSGKIKSEIAMRIAVQVLGSALLTKHCLVTAGECFSASVLLGNDVSTKILFTFNVFSSADTLMTNWYFWRHF